MGVYISFNPSTGKLLIKIPTDLMGSLFITTLETSLGFSEIGTNRFTSETEGLSNRELFETIRNVVDLLVSENIKFAADKGVSELLKRASDDSRRREAVNLEAKRLLRKKVVSPDELTSTEFKRSLKKYQEEPVRLMVRVPYAANFSVPGSGKTGMLYAAYSRLKAVGEIKKLFIIAPSAAYIAWAEEYEKCFGKKPKIARITGSKYRRLKIYNQSDKHEIFITTYQTAASDVGEISTLLKSDNFLLVLDESHNIKRFGGGVWSSAVQKLAVHATRRVILTGTPVPNSLFDLWSQFYFLNPEIIGTKAQFKSLAQKKNAAELFRDKLMPYYRRIKKKDLNLPNPIYKLVLVKANKLQGKIYKAIKQANLKELQYTKVDKMFLGELRKAIMIRLMQAASNPSLLSEKSEEFQVPSMQKDKMAKFIEPSIIDGIKQYSKFETPIKIEAAVKLARNILRSDKSKKLLIWSVWIKNLNVLAKMLNEFNPVVIYGDVPINEEQDPVDNRERRIKKFKEDQSCRILIANPGACGESISLHDVCHDAIYLDRTFNAGQYMQSLDRIHRVGLDPNRKTTYYLLQVEGTIDETINRRLDEKRARMAKVLNEDFEVINLETKLGEISGGPEDSQKDFNETIKDLKK